MTVHLIDGSDRESEFRQTRFDGDPRESGGLGDPRDSTPADGSGFGGGPEATCPLIEHGLQAGVLRFDVPDCGVPHASYATSRAWQLNRLFWRNSVATRPARGASF